MPSSPSQSPLSRRLGSTATSRQLLARLRWHRRSLGIALLVLAMLVAARMARPSPPPTTAVVVADHELHAGEQTRTGDFRIARTPTDSVPAGTLRALPPTGRVVTVPIHRGEIVTDVRLLGPDLLTGLGGALVAAPVHLADATSAALVHVGDTIDVLSAGEDGRTDVVADRAQVLAVPPATSSSSLRTATENQLLVVGVDSPTALQLARAAATTRLSLVLRAATDHPR